MDFDRVTLIRAREACWQRYCRAVEDRRPYVEWARLIWLRFAATLNPEVWGSMYMEARNQ